MIKSLKRNDIRSTPFVANKSWNSQNQTFDNTISWQSGSQSGSLFLSFVDYKDGTQLSLHSSSIAYQQQDPDFLRFRIGQEITGNTFYPTSSKYYDSSVNPTNIDGTYQGLVYNTLKNLFYKETANPTQIFGLESLNPVDVNRTLTKQINVFNVPQNKFGEKIVPNSIEIKQQLDDGHFVVIDDGNTNLKLSGSHFVDVQNAMYNCVSAIINVTNTSYTYDGSPKSVKVTTIPSDLTTITTYNGSETPPTNAGTYTILSTILDGYYCGSTGSTFIISPKILPIPNPEITVIDDTVEYDGTSKSLAATTTPSDLPYTIEYKLEGVVVQYPTNVGTYIATATITGNPTATDVGSLIIYEKVKPPPKPTLNVIDDTVDYDGTSKSLNVTTSYPQGLEPIEYKLYGVVVQSPTNFGTYIATATVKDSNYTIIANGTLTINKKQLEVKFPIIPPQEYGTSKSIELNAYSDPKKFDITYSITSGQKLAKILTKNGISEIQITGQNANGIINHEVGDVTVKASTDNLTNKNYLPASENRTFTVTPKPITLNPTVSYPGSGLNVTIFTPSISSKLVLGSGDDVTITGPSAGTIASSAAGTYPVITGSSYALVGDDAAKYSLKQPTLTVTVNPTTIQLLDSFFKYDGSPYTIKDIINKGYATLTSGTYIIKFFTKKDGQLCLFTDNTDQGEYPDPKNRICEQTYYTSGQVNTNIGPFSVGEYSVTITNENSNPKEIKEAKLTISQANAYVEFEEFNQDNIKYLQFNNCLSQIEKIEKDKINIVKIKKVYYYDRTGEEKGISPIPSELKVTYDGNVTVPTVSKKYKISVTGVNANFIYNVSDTLYFDPFSLIYIIYKKGDSFVQDSSPKSGLYITSSQYYTSSNYNLLKFYHPNAVVYNWANSCSNNAALTDYKLTDYKGFSSSDLAISFILIGAGGGAGGSRLQPRNMDQFTAHYDAIGTWPRVGSSGGGGAYVAFSMPAKYLVDNNIDTMKMVTYGVGESWGNDGGISGSGIAGGPAFFVTGNSYTTNSAWLGIYAGGGGGAPATQFDYFDWSESSNGKNTRGSGGKSYINQQSRALYTSSVYPSSVYPGNTYYTNIIGGQTIDNDDVFRVGIIQEFNTAQNGLPGINNLWPYGVQPGTQNWPVATLGGLNGYMQVSIPDDYEVKSQYNLFGHGRSGFTDYSPDNSSFCEIRIRNSIYQIYLNGNKIYDVNNFNPK